MKMKDLVQKAIDNRAEKVDKLAKRLLSEIYSDLKKISGLSAQVFDIADKKQRVQKAFAQSVTLQSKIEKAIIGSMETIPQIVIESFEKIEELKFTADKAKKITEIYLTVRGFTGFTLEGQMKNRIEKLASDLISVGIFADQLEEAREQSKSIVERFAKDVHLFIDEYSNYFMAVNL